jgi:threonine/homoserine/homoserine lactone efflux protein
MILINGVLCLVSAGWMLRTFSQVQDKETNQALQKFMWMYLTLLVLVGVHHVVIATFAVRHDVLASVLDNGLMPIIDLMHAVGGFILCVYLQTRRKHTITSG